MAYGKWSASKSAKRDFAKKMQEIETFCAENGIERSRTSDSYYFTLKGCKYRVSNHSIEASNAAARSFNGETIREKYHPDKREEDVVYIHASKTRIIEIYSDLKAGIQLDGRGNRKCRKTKAL